LPDRIAFWLTLFALPFKSKSRLEAENAALRHQVIVLRRRVSASNRRRDIVHLQLAEVVKLKF